jgi:hypothetical protein
VTFKKARPWLIVAVLVFLDTVTNGGVDLVDRIIARRTRRRAEHARRRTGQRARRTRSK